MNINPQDTTTKPISDDQDLAKALAGVLPDKPETPVEKELGMEFEETPALPVIQLPDVEPVSVGPQPAEEPVTPEVEESIILPGLPEAPQAQEEVPTPETVTASVPVISGLDAIKNKALDELRPLINKAELPAEEKFDTYLMLIRSTDDASLIEPAHDAAQAITDETRKAEALIDIIKEIDYLSKKSK